LRQNPAKKKKKKSKYLQEEYCWIAAFRIRFPFPFPTVPATQRLSLPEPTEGCLLLWETCTPRPGGLRLERPEGDGENRNRNPSPANYKNCLAESGVKAPTAAGRGGVLVSRGGERSRESEGSRLPVCPPAARSFSPPRPRAGAPRHLTTRPLPRCDPPSPRAPPWGSCGPPAPSGPELRTLRASKPTAGHTAHLLSREQQAVGLLGRILSLC